MHLLFLCPFSKAAWFCHPWYVNVEHFAVSHQSVPDMIQGMLSSRHPHASITNLYTFLWCLWKARNDTLFGRKQRKPSQIFASTNAVLQGYKLEDTTTTIEHQLEANAHSRQIIPTGDFTRDPSACSVAIFSDAAWKQDGHSPKQALQAASYLGLIPSGFFGAAGRSFCSSSCHKTGWCSTAPGTVLLH